MVRAYKPESRQPYWPRRRLFHRPDSFGVRAKSLNVGRRIRVGSDGEGDTIVFTKCEWRAQAIINPGFLIFRMGLALNIGVDPPFGPSTATNRGFWPLQIRRVDDGVSRVYVGDILDFTPGNSS